MNGVGDGRGCVLWRNVSDGVGQGKWESGEEHRCPNHIYELLRT